jgi:nicotinamide-nucleotide amidase
MLFLPEGWEADVHALAVRLRARNWRLATAESCTGGLVAAACTAVAGSSEWFDRGFVTYSNEAKHELLGVPRALIDAHGAVSAPVARAMAEGAIARSGADLAVSVTGIAGPGGATPDKPVGTVWLGWCCRGEESQAQRLQLQGGRADVRAQTVGVVLQRLAQLAQAPEAS